jgi:hypothetical protein
MLKDQNSPGANMSQSSLSSPSLQSQSPSLPVYSGATNAVLSTPPPTFHNPNLGLPQSYQSSSAFTGVAPPSKGFISPGDTQPEAVSLSTTAHPGPSDTSFLSHGFGHDVFWPGWPRDLPSPSLVRHLYVALVASFVIPIERFYAASRRFSPSIPMQADYFTYQLLFPGSIYHQTIPISPPHVSYTQSVQLEAFIPWLYFRRHHRIKPCRRICPTVTALTMRVPSTALCRMTSSATVTDGRTMLILLLKCM